MGLIAFIISVIFLAPITVMMGLLLFNIARAVGAVIAIPILTTYYWTKDKLEWTTNA